MTKRKVTDYNVEWMLKLPHCFFYYFDFTVYDMNMFLQFLWGDDCGCEGWYKNKYLELSTIWTVNPVFIPPLTPPSFILGLLCLVASLLTLQSLLPRNVAVSVRMGGLSWVSSWRSKQEVMLLPNSWPITGLKLNRRSDWNNLRLPLRCDYG